MSNIKNKLLIYLPLLVLMTSACKPGERGAVRADYPKAFVKGQSSDTAGIGSKEWRTFFTDPYLKALIDTAIVKNADIALAVKRTLTAEAYLRQARVAYLPSLSLNAAATTVTPSKNSLNGLSLEKFLGQRHIEDYNLNAGLSWELDIWGRIRNQKRAALNEYLRSEEAAKAVQTRTVSTLARSYYNLQLLDAQLQVAQRNRQLSDSIVLMVRLQQEAGETTSLAVQQAVNQSLSVAALIASLENAIAVEENAINVLLGRFATPVLRGSLQESVFPAAWPAGVPAQVLANRPDVKANEFSLKAAYARTGMARASLYPSVVITASGGLNAFKAAEWFTVPGSLFSSVGGGITQPLFRRRELRTQLQVTRLEQEQAEIQFRQSVITAAGEVNTALVTIDKLSEREKIVAEQVQIGQESIGNARLLFSSGMATYLEVINAQANLLQAELSVQSVRSQKFMALVDLYRSLGGGWR